MHAVIFFLLGPCSIFLESLVHDTEEARSDIIYDCVKLHCCIKSLNLQNIACIESFSMGEKAIIAASAKLEPEEGER